MDHLIRKVIFDAEYFQPGVAVYLETEETKQQGLIYTYSEDELTILKIRDVMTADNQMQVEPAQIQIHVSEVERNDIKIYRIDDSRSTNREKLTTVCEKLTRSYMALSNSLSEQERLLAEQKAVEDAYKKKMAPYKAKEKEDYKRFFAKDNENKQLMFYSESSGFYKYYRGMIEELLENSDIVIHYVTSDPEDQVFQIRHERFKAYYIGEIKLITLMMKLDCDIVVMTMPDLETYHIKRSYVRKDMEYIHVPHSIDSMNMTYRKGSIDHFDTIFCVGPHHKDEVEKMEETYDLPHKVLLNWGYCLLDDMRKDYESKEKVINEQKTILIAPSWQEDNIVDSCLEDILQKLRATGYKVIVRPHPQHVRHMPEKMQLLKDKFAEDKNIEIQTDFSSNDTVFNADLIITDWSGIAYEYAFTTLRPVLYINTPMKIMNPEYEKIGVVPINIFMRDSIGCSLNLDQLDRVADEATRLIEQRDLYHDKIDAFVKQYVYHLGTSAKVGANYIKLRLKQIHSED